MHWIALHLPLLSLESFAATLPAGLADAPLGLQDEHHVRCVNAAAQALGIQAGMKRATALALAPHLVLGRADPVRDSAALTAVAHAALAFTPQVVVPPAEPGAAAPHTVLLEVEPSLRCFGGREALVRRLLASVAPLGHRVNLVGAPTAHGAALLARVHPRLHCADLAAARRALDAAPVWLVGPGREHWEALQGMGLHTIADLTCLPRSGLSRRFGPALLAELDRALGHRPDPRRPIVLPPVFESRIELFTLADSAEQLLRGAGVLLARLVAWLAARHAFVRRFALLMDHERHRRSDPSVPATTSLEIALAEPARDAAHLLVLLRERLAQLSLPAPTLQLRLHAADVVVQAAPNTELFPTPRGERDGLLRLLERLQARLGTDHIQRLVAVNDHRPEFASARQPARLAPASKPRRRPDAPAALPRRPVWLLAEPEALVERPAGPLLDGRPLQLLSGPERIETGWWDDRLAERDYFIAQTPEGALVWVYRARLQLSAPEPGWFLHGRFG